MKNDKPVTTLAFPSVRSKVYQPNSVLFLQGEKADGVYLIRNGRVRLVMYGSTGRVVLERIHDAGDILGLPAIFSQRPFSMTAETCGRVEIAFIPRAEFLAAMSENTKLGFVCLQNAESRGTSEPPMPGRVIVRIADPARNYCEDHRTVQNT